jgi:hypothetical protein
MQPDPPAPLDYASPQARKRRRWRVPFWVWPVVGVAGHTFTSSFVMLNVVPTPEVADYILFPLGYLPRDFVFAKVLRGNTNPYLALFANEVLFSAGFLSLTFGVWIMLRRFGRPKPEV